MFNILILGGYGNFGARIARSLANESGLRLIVAGRDVRKARLLGNELKEHGASSEIDAVSVDQSASNLAEQIAALKVQLMIHTAGPYQGQNYQVATACLHAGANYLDLADGREFVAGIGALDDIAREKDLLVVSGASTLPALSSAVVDALKARFSRIDSIDIGVAPGQRTQRGLATLQGVLSYCGKPFRVWEKGGWKEAFGWQGMQVFSYPDLGRRLLLRCNVPDLELFPGYYAPTDRVRFDAALELFINQIAFWTLSWLARVGVVRAPDRLAPLLLRAGHFLDRFGSDTGGMHVRLRGIDPAGKALVVTWLLTAKQGSGPEIPVIPAIVLAKKLAKGNLKLRGAHPCLSMISLAEFMSAVRHLPIDTQIVEALA